MFILQDVISRIHTVSLDIQFSGTTEEFLTGWDRRCEELGQALTEEHGISKKTVFIFNPNMELGPKSAQRFRELNTFFLENG